LKTEIELRQAIKRDNLRLHYQPLVNLQNGRIIGAEALVRWEHPERGLIGPNEFIPLAEESGMIVPLGQWVLREACCQMKKWQKKYFGDDPWVMSVNLSAKQFQQPGLADEIARVLKEARLAPRCLNLEITESVMMEAATATTGALTALRKLGVQLSLDDFGTGYSSLSYLRRFPLDTLKVDRSFIDLAGHSGQDAAIVQAVHSLARALGMKVVAEGVETREQLDHLRALECDVGQGFFFSRPLPTDEFEKLLSTEPQW
jgi:EAL domain-containing protein (putative c-di-GMP-specific phosphodiesterase class I)